MGRKGTIVRITLNNFGTYRHIEMLPGPNLNLILGPNGTGKSTLMSAIVLGLGGNPKVIGRASQLSDYIKRNCDEADVEIELDSGDENKNVVIKRKFNKENHSYWKMNGKSTHLRNVLDRISQMHIQVNNLCQFLPQDRVQDFAKMDNRQLLVNTQQSVGPVELSTYHSSLITYRQEHKGLESKLSKLGASLEEADQKNQRIAGAVKNIQEKRSLTLSLKHARGKLAWVDYDLKRNAVMEAKVDKETAEKEIKKYREKMAPINKQIEKTKQNVASIQQSIIHKSRLVSNVGNNIRNQIESVERIFQSIASTSNELEHKKNDEKQREALVNAAKLKVSKLRADVHTIESSIGTVDDAEQELNSIKSKLISIEEQFDILNAKKSSTDYVLENLNDLLRETQAEKIKLENVRNQRLDLLRKIDSDVYESVLWLRQNKHLFRGNVYEPILLEINITNPEYSKYFENIISVRDLCLFTCEEVTDMNLLITKLRTEKKLRVSVVHSGTKHTPYSAYKPPIPIDQIQQYGFSAYANTLLTGPEPIMKYLCRNNRLHAVPIGNARVNDLYDQVPANINMFFSDTKRFVVSVSQYTSEKSTRISDITPNHLLSLSLNMERVTAINNKMQMLTTKRDETMRNIAQIDTELKKIVETRNTSIIRRKELYSNRDTLTKIRARLTATIQNLQSLEQTEFNIEDEIRQCDLKIKQYIDQIMSTKQIIIDQMRKQKSHLIEMEVTRQQLELTQGKVIKLTTEHHQLVERCNQIENSLNNIKSQLDILRAEAKRQFEKARLLTDDLTPGDKEQFKAFDKIFNKLPNNVDELNEHIDDIKSKIDCMDNLKDDVLTEFEERMQLIDQLIKDKNDTHASIQSLEQKMQQLKEKWLEPLEELISRINRRFEQYFKKLGCIGDVSLVKANNELDFNEYGLSIKVSYREGEIAKELDQYVQSGGERAVATAIFMLSLQELTYVPFRCVDEINQGMDAVNERKVFELIVDATEQENTSQYFLLSPKLLPGLKYSRRMKVHIIHNGPGETSGDHYNVKKFVQAIQETPELFKESQSCSQTSYRSQSPNY